MPFLATTDKQELLETSDVAARLERINRHLAKELEVQQLRNKIQSEVQDQVQQSQRDYYLREQLKAIQKELGEMDEGQKDIEELRQKIENAGMPEETKKEAVKELNRLSRMSPMAADYSLTRNYIEWLAVLPWAKSSGEEVNIIKAKEILDEDHYDLKKVKDRILDYLSVRRLKPDMKGPILCFVGPPGVGRPRWAVRLRGRWGGSSSVSRWAACMTRRSFAGIAGLTSARCRGRSFRTCAAQRRTIRSSCWTRSISSGRDFRGDPSSALLEILDPEQNNTFRDNYLDVQFDLSKVLFICTANMLDPIPEPLRDRMEIIDLSGYTEEEKKHIAFRYLIPRQIKENGIQPDNIEFPDDSVELYRSPLHAGSRRKKAGAAHRHRLPQTSQTNCRGETGKAGGDQGDH